MFDKILYILNRLATLFGAALSIAYAYATFGNTMGFVLGILFALSELVVIWMAYQHFYKLSKGDAETQRWMKRVNETPMRELKLSNKSLGFLCLVIPCIIFSGISSFIGMYKAVLLLGGSAAFVASPIPLLAFTIAAIIFACVTTTAATLTASRTAYNIFKMTMIPMVDEKISSNKLKNNFILYEPLKQGFIPRVKSNKIDASQNYSNKHFRRHSYGGETNLCFSFWHKHKKLFHQNCNEISFKEKPAKVAKEIRQFCSFQRVNCADSPLI